MDKKLKKLEELWKNRTDNADEVAKLLSTIYSEKSTMNPYQIAIRLGALSVEVLAFLSFYYLSSKVKKNFLKKKLPITIALDLIDEEPEIQAKIINEIDADGNVIDDLIRIKKKYSEKTIKKYLWVVNSTIS